MVEPGDVGTQALAVDARAIASKWREEMDLGRLASELLETSDLRAATIDLVAVGKVSLEMSAAVANVLGARVRRRLAVIDESVERRDASAGGVVVGDHPVPRDRSLRAGKAVLDFLDEPGEADATLFLISGGASSLCVVPAWPLTLGDLASVWESALRSGVDITTLNMIRAASSLISGGALLRHVHTPRSASFILVDNVVSGAQWVASAMTYDFRPTEAFVSELWDRIGIEDAGLRSRLFEGFAARSALLAITPATQHENAVLAEPAMMLEFALQEATRRGYHVIDMGAHIFGDVNDVVAQWASVIAESTPGPVAVIGVGEVTVKVDASGTGGRCQEFAWLMADVLARGVRTGIFLAQASDGRDHVEGVGGAWVDDTTTKAARERGIDWARVAASHDTCPALTSLSQLIEGGHTGWNLCDLYVAVLG